jgi:hypothetical protein
MAASPEEWNPGSFTKNFSWGDKANGLLRLYDSIRLGFDGALEDTPRAAFRTRVRNDGGPDYIPLNFFLFNKPKGAIDYVIADELVFQALTAEHSARFDKLALFAFNFSFVGTWKGAHPSQRRPALWAYHYIRDRVAKELQWNTSLVNADDIEKFIKNDPHYHARTTRKLSTNLSYLYSIGRLAEFSERRVTRWWVDTLFLALDRLIEDRKLDGLETGESEYMTLLSRSGFPTISGQNSLEKNLAVGHLVDLYRACGGRDRFSDDQVRERTAVKLPDIERFVANDFRPIGAVHPTNPQILKSLPRACAMLARYVGFDVIDADELAAFSADEFIQRQTKNALERLREQNVLPTMSAEELMKLTRKK